MNNRLEQEALLEAERRRSHVASWIQNSLQVVNRLIKYDGLLPDIPDSNDNEVGLLTSEFEVREYQLDAWAALWEARQRGQTRGLVHLATGLGKTSVAVFDVMKFREEQLSQRSPIMPRVLFVSHTNEILRQAERRFKSFMPDLDFAYFSSGKDYLPSGQVDADVTFATFQSLRNMLHDLDPEDFEYIIYDEAHHIEAPTFKKVRDHFNPLFELGLTATPDRLDDKDIREYFGDASYSKGLAEALSEEWLATPDYHIVFDDAVKEAMQSGFHVNGLKALKRLFNVRPRNDTIANNIHEEMDKIGLEFGSVKTIVFCHDIEHAEEMAKLLGGKAYHSEIDRKDRKEIFDEFKKGDLQVITTRDMFNEGVDIPDARLLVFLRSTSSPTIFEQQLGRGLRKAPGKERVTVLDFVANVERIAMVKDLAQEVREASMQNRGENAETSKSSGGLEEELVIHTNHGEFDFDKLTIDLLEKYNKFSIKEWHIYKDYSNDELVELALKLSPDAPITSVIANEFAKQQRFPSADTIRARFGGMNEFRKACGFDIAWYTLSDNELLERADILSPGEYLTTPAINALKKEGKFVSSNLIRDRFGTVKKFNEMRGCFTDFTKLSNQEVVELAKSLSDTVLKTDDINKLYAEGKFPESQAIAKRFGSVLLFQEACGYRNYNTYTDDELVELANELCPGKPIKVTEVTRLSKEGRFVSTKAIDRRFGNIAAFNERRGFIDPKAKFLKMTDDELVTLAKELSPNRRLTVVRMQELSSNDLFPTPGYIEKRFGSQKAFREACGR